MNPALRTSAAHLVVDSLEAPDPSPDDAHHLFRVLRVRDGEVVTVCDGEGGWRPTRVAGGALLPDGPVVRDPQPAPCTIAVAIPKGDRLDWMVQKLTEVGITRLVLVDYARSVVRWDAAKRERQLERVRRIAREASLQSRRTWLPMIDGPVPFAVAAALPGARLAEPDGEPGPLGDTVLVGPEGGFGAEELAAGLPAVSLGPNVLRVETAALVACTRILTKS